MVLRGRPFSAHTVNSVYLNVTAGTRTICFTSTSGSVFLWTHFVLIFGNFIASMQMLRSIINHCYSGCHETPGTWRQHGLEDEVADISVVVDYLAKTFGYQVDLIVGHSRGSLVAMRWLCTTEGGKKVSGFVNVSGRYRMHVSLSILKRFALQHLFIYS